MVRLGIIGLGKWGQVLARAAQQSSRFCISKGFSRSAATRAAFESDYGIVCPDEVQTILADLAQRAAFALRRDVRRGG